MRVVGSRESGVGSRESGVRSRESGVGSRESGVAVVILSLPTGQAGLPKDEVVNSIQ